jgi:hypothetical protein
LFLPQNPALDLSDEVLENGEISGEFGDNISMSSRGPDKISPEFVAPPLPPEEEIKYTFWDNFKIIKPNHMKALLWKNFLWMWRNVGVMAFIIGLPVGQIILFCISIGKDPIGLHLAIANHELTEQLLLDQNCPVYKGCNYTHLSCRYLKLLTNKTLITVRRK